MASCISLSTNLKKEVVNSLLDSLQNLNENSWFIAFGNPIPWSSKTTTNSSTGFFSPAGRPRGNDLVIPVPEDNDLEKYDFWRSCVGMKKINRDDLAILIPKNEWEQNRVYYPYRYTENMFEDPEKIFHVYNSDNRCVYKCIENNAGLSGGQTSQIGGSLYKPSSTGLEIFDTGDGYKWKLIYQLSPADELKFSVDGRNSQEDSYIPIRYIDFQPNVSETEYLKTKSVQDNAVPGSISSIYLNPEYNGLITYDDRYSILGIEDAIYPGEQVSQGATSFRVDYFGSNNTENSLRDMVFYVIDGPGEGQSRVIKSSEAVRIGGSKYLVIEVDPLDEGLSAFTSLEETKSAINIIPQLTIVGDGEARSPTAAGNSNLKSALGLLTFTPGPTFVVNGVDLIDIGKNYTYARAFVPKGLTAVNSSTQVPNDLFSLSLSPPNGHGSNGPSELGASRILIKTSFQGSENGRIEAVNDFRQIALIKNPILRDKIAIIRTVAGVGSGITEGSNVTITGSSAILDGVVLSKTLIGDDSSHEFLINGLSGTVGDFDYISGILIDPSDGFELIEIAGQENTEYVPLEAEEVVQLVDSRDILVGVGNKSLGIVPSYASGKVLEVDAKTVKVSPIRGKFKQDEKVYAFDRDGTYSSVFTIDQIGIPVYEGFRNAYSTVTTLEIQSEVNEFFEKDTFEQDQIVYSFEDSSESSIEANTVFKGSAYCFDWTADLGPTGSTPSSYNLGTLKIVGAKPESFEVGDYIAYYTDSSIPKYAIINNVVKPEILYGSGEILYIQNFPPIERNYQTDEEINLVIGF